MQKTSKRSAKSKTCLTIGFVNDSTEITLRPYQRLVSVMEFSGRSGEGRKCFSSSVSLYLTSEFKWRNSKIEVKK